MKKKPMEPLEALRFIHRMALDYHYLGLDHKPKIAMVYNKAKRVEALDLIEATIQALETDQKATR